MLSSAALVSWLQLCLSSRRLLPTIVGACISQGLARLPLVRRACTARCVDTRHPRQVTISGGVHLVLIYVVRARSRCCARD